MGKYEKKKSVPSGGKRMGFLIGCLAAAVIIVALAVFLSGKMTDQLETVPQKGQEQTVQTQPGANGDASTPPGQTYLPSRKLIVESVEQEDQMMVITTSYCVLKYPFAFSDMIRVMAAEQEDRAELLFCAYLNKAEYPLFSIIFDGAGGIDVGTLKLDDGTTVSVTAQIFEADTSIDPTMLTSFYAAQETINDVISSLYAVDGFVAVK